MRDVFSAVFFVAIGMQIDARELWQQGGLILGIAAFTLVARPLAVATGLSLIGTPLKDGLRTGLTATPIGEFSFIIAQLGVGAEVVPAQFYPLAVGVSLVTTLVAPFIMRRSEQIAENAVADADRCAVALPGPQGWRVLRGDEVGALLGDFLLRSGVEGVYASSIVSSTRISGAHCCTARPVATASSAEIQSDVNSDTEARCRPMRRGRR